MASISTRRHNCNLAAAPFAEQVVKVDWKKRLGLTLTAVAALAGGVARAGTHDVAAAAVRGDLRLAVATIEANHPDLGHSVQRRELDRRAGAIERQLKQPMNRTEAWLALAQLNPVLADGHLFIGLPGWREDSLKALAAGPGFFPYEVTVDARGALRVVSALGGAPTPLAGRRVRRINGQDADQIVRRLLGRVHGDTSAFRRALLAQRWWFFYATAYGAPASFQLDLAGGERQVLAASLQTPALLRQETSFERTYACEVRRDGAVLTVSSFSWADKAKVYVFTHDCFARIAAAGVTRLVIDVRQNGGGDDDMWEDGLLRYIADRPYRHGSSYIKRVLKPQDPGEIAGQIVRGAISSDVTPPASEPLRFRGQVYVLVGPLTYSSAVLFANVVQDYGFAKLAGVGGAVRTRQSGGVQTFRLPNTGLILYYPRFVLDRPSGASSPAYVKPDLPIEDDPLHPEAAVNALLKASN